MPGTSSPSSTRSILQTSARASWALGLQGSPGLIPILRAGVSAGCARQGDGGDVQGWS